MGWPVCVVSLLCVVVCIHAELVAVGPGGGATAFGGGLRLGTLKPDTPARCELIHSDTSSGSEEVLHSFPCTRAEFGAPLPLVVPGLLLPVRVPRQPFGCEFPGEGALAGAVAVVRRGVCSFQAKASTMEQAGAAAVVVVNTPGSNVFRMPPGGAFGRPEVNVPAVMTSHRDGEVVMKAALEHEDAQVGADSVQQEQLLLRMHEVADAAATAAEEARLLHRIKSQPHDPDAHAALSSLYTATGRQGDARKHERAVHRVELVRELHRTTALADDPTPEQLRHRLGLLKQLGSSSARDGLLEQSARAFWAAADTARRLVPRGVLAQGVLFERALEEWARCLQAAADALDDMGYLDDAVDVLRLVIDIDDNHPEPFYQLGMLLLRQCQSVTPVNRFEFDPPIPQLDMQGSVDGDAANEFSPPVAGKSPPHSFDCPTIEDALVALTSAGRLFEAQRRVEREIDRWETEVDFWAAAFGGKEALYQRATEPLKQKLRHDVAQMHYLQNQRFANSSFDPQGVPFLPVAHALTKFLEFLEMNHDSAPVVLDSVLSLQPHEQVYVAETYNIQTFFPPRHRLGACGRDRLAPCLNPDLDLSALQRQYPSTPLKPAHVVVDDLLTDEALRGLRHLAEEGTVWHDPADGWIGTSLQTGFVSEVVLRVALELREAFPDILCHHELRSVWSKKYDNTIVPVSEEEHAAWVSKKAAEDAWRKKNKHAPFDEDAALPAFPHLSSNVVTRPRGRAGVPVHFDDAAVKVNMWITRPGAGVTEDDGGLVLYAKPAPLEWDPLTTTPDAAREWLRAHKADEAHVVAHRPNRAVIFDSSLFHETDGGSFQKGYLNKRISVSFVFGFRGDTCSSSSA